MFRDKIQELMKQDAGIIREEQGFKKDWKRISELKREFYSKDNISNESKFDMLIENVVLT